MIAVDTNILARFYCDDPDDPEAAKQRPRARRVMLDSPAVFVPLTVILEFKRVMRGFYDDAIFFSCPRQDFRIRLAAEASFSDRPTVHVRQPAP